MKKVLALVLCLALLLLPAGCAQKNGMEFPEAFVDASGRPEKEVTSTLQLKYDGNAEQYNFTVPVLGKDCAVTLSFLSFRQENSDSAAERLLNYTMISSDLPDEAASFDYMRSVYDRLEEVYGAPYSVKTEMDGFDKGKTYDTGTLFSGLAAAEAAKDGTSAIQFLWQDLGENDAVVQLSCYPALQSANGKVRFTVNISPASEFWSD